MTVVLTAHEKLDRILEQQAQLAEQNARIEERFEKLDETIDWLKDRIYDLENDFNDGYSVEVLRDEDF